LPTGTDATAGAATGDGPGTGAGGFGAGAGSGGRGSGTGGGAAVRAERISGRLSGDTDYPASARRAGVEGSVSVRFVVGTDGRVGGCRVTRSSGHAELDSTTCRLIEERFRYRPARDADGRPVQETVSRTFDWLLPFRH
jgi:protein TonB